MPDSSGDPKYLLNCLQNVSLKCNNSKGIGSVNVQQ